MRDAFLCEGARTPVGRYGGSLVVGSAGRSSRPCIKAVMAKAPRLPG